MHLKVQTNIAKKDFCKIKPFCKTKSLTGQMTHLIFVLVKELKRPPSGLQTPSALATLNLKICSHSNCMSHIRQEKGGRLKQSTNSNIFVGQLSENQFSQEIGGHENICWLKETTMIPKNLWDNILLHSRILKALQITFYVERVYTRKSTFGYYLYFKAYENKGILI